MTFGALDIVRINSMVAGLIITIGLYSQCIKIFRTRSAHDLSFLLIISLFYNEISWFIYGYGIGEWPVILLTVITFPAEIIVFIGYLRYGRKG